MNGTAFQNAAWTNRKLRKTGGPITVGTRHGTFTSTQTSVGINDGLSLTAALGDIMTMFTSQSGSAAVSVYVNSITSTGFNANLNVAPRDTVMSAWSAMLH